MMSRYLLPTLVLSLGLSFSLSSVQSAETTAGGAVDQDFEGGSELPAGFKAVKGDWKVADGTLTGAELKSDMHAAVLGFGEKNTDSVISFRLRFDGAEFFHLSLNHAKGHLFRVIFQPATGMSINKDGDKKNPEIKAMVLGKQAGAISSGEWHTVKVAISGESVTATLDDGKPLEVSHPGLKTEKTGYRLIVKGESIAVDDIHVEAAK